MVSKCPLGATSATHPRPIWRWRMLFFFSKHDGASCHTAKAITRWTNEWGIHVFGPWPVNSPDPNPIANLQSVLKKKVEKQKLRQGDHLQVLVKKSGLPSTGLGVKANIQHARTNCLGLARKRPAQYILNVPEKLIYMPTKVVKNEKTFIILIPYTSKEYFTNRSRRD